MARTPTHPRKNPPPGSRPVVIQGKAVSATSLRSSGSASRSSTTENAAASATRRSNAGKQQSSAKTSNGSSNNAGRRVSASSASKTKTARPSPTTQPKPKPKPKQRQPSSLPPPLQRKAPPSHLLTNARTSIPGAKIQKQQRQNQSQNRRRQRPPERQSLQSVRENEVSTSVNGGGFEALTWSLPSANRNSVTENGGERWSEVRQSSTATILSSDASMGTVSITSSSNSANGMKKVSNLVTGKTLRKIGSKLSTSVGAKAKELTSQGGFYETGEAGYSTNIRTITEEEASGQFAAAGEIVSITRPLPQCQASTQPQSQQSQQLQSNGRAASNRRHIPTALARLASNQNMNIGATASAQVVPSTTTPTVTATATVVALRPPAPVVVGGKVVVKGVALNKSLKGDLDKIDATVRKYRTLRLSVGHRADNQSIQSNAELAESIAELRACIPKLEALVNRAMLSKTADANVLERCLSLNDELRKMLASLKGEGIKRRVRARPIRASQLPLTQAAREQQLFKKMRDDSDEIRAAALVHPASVSRDEQKEEPLFHDDPFYQGSFPDFDSIPDDEWFGDDTKERNIDGWSKIKSDDDSKSASDTSSMSVRPVVSEDDENDSLWSDSIQDVGATTGGGEGEGTDKGSDKNGISRLEFEVARLEKQLSGLDPLAHLAMDAIIDEETSHMSALSLMSDESADAGFANMERDVMKRLAMGNDWVTAGGLEESNNNDNARSSTSRVQFSHEVTVFEIPNRLQQRATEA